MDRFNKLVVAARYYLLGKGFLKALNALELGLEIHDGFRKDGVTPEFMHQIQIFHYLRTIETNLMYPEETYIAAFLHDAKEDYKTKKGITESFIKQRDYPERATNAIFLLDKHGRTMDGYFEILKSCPIASIVKCADRAHNMSTMTGVFNREKQLRYMDEVEKFFMPMIKFSRRVFPRQEPAYENVKHVLNIQLDLLDVINATE